MSTSDLSLMSLKVLLMALSAETDEARRAAIQAEIERRQ